MKIVLPIPVPMIIVWLEVNIFGKTILPELYTCLMVGGYITWRIWLWKSQLGIKTIG